MSTPVSSLTLPAQHQIVWKPKSFREVKYNDNPLGVVPYRIDLVFDPQIELAASYTFWLNGRREIFTYDPESAPAGVQSDLLLTLTLLSGDSLWNVTSLGGTTNLYGFGTAYQIDRAGAGSFDHFRFYIEGRSALPPVSVFLQIAGSTETHLEGYLAKFDYAELSTVVDKSGVNSRYEMLDEGRHSMSFNLTILSDNDNIPEYVLYDGAIGELTIYEGPIIEGTKFGRFYAIIEEVKKSVSDAGVETTIRGRRMGAPISPFGSIL